MKYIRILPFIVFAFLIGCQTSSPIPGILVTSGSVHISDRASGGLIGSANVVKKGRSCSWGVFLVNLIYMGGGNSIKQAMDKGEIKKVAVVDHYSMNILGPLFYMDCIEVWGE